MKKKLMFGFLLAALVAALASPAAAADWRITITNAAHGSYFTPFILTAHSSDHLLFQVGQPATDALQMMAEGGDISGLVTRAGNAGADVVENPANGLLAPGESVTAQISTSSGNTRLSLTAMIVPSNDGFVGLDSLEAPLMPGVYTYFLNAYDAGTEANNEVLTPGSGTPGVLGVPGDPTGLAATGASGVTTTEENQTVHIHRGILGEAAPAGGTSDLINSVHRWLNPIAKLVIVVR